MPRQYHWPILSREYLWTTNLKRTVMDSTNYKVTAILEDKQVVTLCDEDQTQKVWPVFLYPKQILTNTGQFQHH